MPGFDWLGNLIGAIIFGLFVWLLTLAMKAKSRPKRWLAWTGFVLLTVIVGYIADRMLNGAVLKAVSHVASWIYSLLMHPIRTWILLVAIVVAALAFVFLRRKATEAAIWSRLTEEERSVLDQLFQQKHYFLPDKFFESKFVRRLGQSAWNAATQQLTALELIYQCTDPSASALRRALDSDSDKLDGWRLSEKGRGLMAWVERDRLASKISRQSSRSDREDDTVRVLEYLAEHEHSKMNDVARGLDLSDASAARLVGTMVKRGHITMCESIRGEVTLQLTKSGRNRVEEK